MTMFNRRETLLAGLFGAQYIGLRALATGLPAWFIALLNSGEAIAWLAKALKPFSISPSMVCHNAAGSLPLSAISQPP